MDNIFEFYSDAAGSTFHTDEKKNRINLNKAGDKGVVCIGVQKNCFVWWWTKLIWPLTFLNEAKNAKGHYYGNNTDTLEAIGILLPFLCIPQKIKKSTLIFYIDNINVVIAWHSKRLKLNNSLSTILLTIQALACYLGCHVTLKFRPRISTKWAKLADDLSRFSTTTKYDIDLLTNAEYNFYTGIFLHWLKNPTETCPLPLLLLRELKNKNVKK